MLKVLFDYQHFSEQRYGGISRYFANIMHEIGQREDVDCELAALYSQNYYIRDLKLPLNGSIGDYFLARKPKREAKWNRLYSQYLLQKGKYDIFHPTYYDPYFLNYVKKPFVLTVHDMIHEKFPEAFVAPHDIVARYKKQVVEKADKIIAISNSTKRDLMALLNVPEEKIEVIYHGVQIHNFPVTPTPLSLDIPNEFILYVGDRNPYKNFNRFAEAVAKVMEHHPNLYLVCTGGLRFNEKEVKWLTDLNIIHRCIRLTVTDQELTELYQNAQAFIFPSLYEGFGFPILEAFQQCCPVICSNTSCFPEVGGDAVAYFDPSDTTNMAQVILQVLANKTLRAQLIEAGKERLLQFPIQRCVDQTIALYKQLV